MLIALAGISLTPQNTLAIELITLLDQIGKYAVEGAIKGFFGAERNDGYFDYEDDYYGYEEDEDYEDEYVEAVLLRR